MNSHVRRFYLVTVILLLFTTPFVKIAEAQDFAPSVGISVILKSSDREEAKNGLIVAKDPSEHYISRSYQDPNIVGVITEQTDFLYTTENNAQKTTVAIEGITTVWVSNTYGPIRYGDFITTSTQPGIGVKARENGSVIGFALENTPDGDGPHLIKIQLAISDFWDGEPSSKTTLTKTGNIFTRFLSNIETEASQGSNTFLYFIVIIILVSVCVAGFFTFGRIAVNGVQAMGRNPLAKNSILKTVIINSFIALIFTVGSLYIVFLLVR